MLILKCKTHKVCSMRKLVGLEACTSENLEDLDLSDAIWYKFWQTLRQQMDRSALRYK